MAPEAEPRSSSPADDSRGRKPRKLGKYRIEKKIGAGGMGAVYLATDTDLNRTVALKILPKDKAENPTLVKRFKAEAQSAAQLRHEHIVSVYEAGAIDDQLYIALEYVEGTDVHHLVARRGVLPVRRSIEIVRQITEALEHAQTKNIVHRDIKPSNLLIRRDGTVKLADLGLARAMDDTAETAITRAGTTVGTVDYMSPEQARDSKAADTRSDLYSLGCTWYHMLTGQPPWPEGSLTGKLHAHATEAPPDPRVHNPAVTDAVVACIHRMMAKNPDDRYQSPRELLEDLSRATLNRETVSNDVLAGLSEAAAALTDEVPLPRGGSSARTVADSDEAADGDSTLPSAAGRRRKRSNRRKPGRAAAAADLSPDYEEEEDAYDEPPAHAEPRPTARRKKRSSRGDDSLEQPAKSSKKKRRSGVTPASSLPADEPVPPRASKYRRSSASGSDSSEVKKPAREKQVRLDPLKLTAVLLIVGGAVFGLQQISARIADGFGSSGTHQNPFGAEEGELAASGEEQAAAADEGTEGEAGQPGQERRAPTSQLTRRNPDETTTSRRPGSGNAGQSGQPANGGPTVRTGSSGSGREERIAVDFQPDREGERPWQPDWLGFVPARETLLEEAAAAGMTVLRVGRGQNSREPGDVETIQAGLAGHDGQDRVLILQGDGPFELPPATIQNSGLLALVAEPSSRPVIVIRSASFGSSGEAAPAARQAPAAEGHFRLTGGTLALLGVHLLAVPGTSGTNTAGPLLSLTDADLVMRDCSITADELPDRSTPDPVTAVSLRGHRPGKHSEPTDRRLRALLDRVTIRGQNITAVDLKPGTIDLVASSCVFMSQLAPLFRLEATSEAPISTAAVSRQPDSGSSTEQKVEQATGDGEKGPVQPVAFSTTETSLPAGWTTAHQVIRLLSTTLVSGSTAMHFQRQADNETGETEIQCVNSVLASTGDGPERTLLELTGWSDRSSPNPERSRVEGLEWKSESSALLGWTQLVHSEEQPSHLVEGSSAWRLLWRETGSSLHIGSGRWPANRLEGLAELQPAALKIDSGSTGTVRATDDTLPGCRETELTVPPAESIARARTLACRPLLSAWLEGQTAASETIPFDLNKANLGEFVSSGRWPDNAIIEATGNGPCSTSPIVIKRGRLTIRFRDSGEKPLILQPKRMKSPVPSALFRVESGGLRLEGARIEIPRPERGSGGRLGLYPPWVFQLGAADVALQNCSISLPMYDTEELSGVIRWPDDRSELDGRDFSTGRPGRYRNSLLISDSWITGEGVLLNASLHQRAVVVRNSVLCPLRDMLQLDITATDGEPDSAVDIHHSTLATPNTVFEINSKTRNSPTLHPLHLFVQSTVFATPPDPGDQIEAESISLKFEGNVLEQSQAVWFGARNGWMLPSFKVLMRGPGMLPVNSPDFDRDWQSRWQTGHVLLPLYRSGDVVLADPAGLPHRNSIKPDSYTLAEQCSAAAWSVTGQPIGADVALLTHQLEGEKKSAKDDKEKQKKGRIRLPSTPRKTAKPGF